MSEMDLELRLFRLMRGMLNRMVDEIDDDDFHLLPAGGGNSPNWILGHLTVTMDYGSISLGREAERVESMVPIYGPGSEATDDKTVLMSKGELVEALGESADRFQEAVELASSEQLDASRDSPILKEQLPSVRDMVGHLLTTHFSLHIGQLSAWRRARGMPSVLALQNSGD